MNESNDNSRNNSKTNKRKYYRKSNKYNKNKKTNDSNAPQGSDIAVIQHSLKSSSQNKRRYNPHNNKNRNYRRDTSNKHFSKDKIYSRYYYLLELHTVARRKYFENTFQSNERIIIKLKNNFDKTQQDIQDFLRDLNETQKNELNQKVNLYPEDTSYSTNHDLDPKGEKSLEDYQIKDPHYLITQKDSDFTNDTEESNGSMEDYQVAKG